MIGLKYLDYLDDWDGYDEGSGYDKDFALRPSPSCNRCGARGLNWRKTERGWRLYERAGVHVCPLPPAHTEFGPIDLSGVLP